MKDYNSYLENLPLTKAVKGRIEEVLNFNRQIHDFDFDDIFVCEMKNEEGARNYTSLWLFTKQYCVECKDFLSNNDFDITPIENNITYCSIEHRDFNLIDSNEKSFVKLHFTFQFNLSGDMISTEENCKWALHIYKKYILPNIKK